MAQTQGRKTPRAIEPPKPQAPSRPPRRRIPSEYPTGAEHTDRNPDAITSVTVIVTYDGKPATSNTWTSMELSSYTDDREVLIPTMERRRITIEALERFSRGT